MALTHDDLTQLLEMVRAGGDVDVVRESVEMVLQALIEAEATEVIGAGLHERTDTRTNQRNGARGRLLSTKAGDVELRRRSVASFCARQHGAERPNRAVGK